MRARIARLVLRISALLPLPVAHLIGTMTGWLMAVFPNRQRLISTINVQRCFPELDDHARRQRVRRSLIETGKTALEVGALWLWRKPRMLALVKQVSGEDALKAALAEGRGAIIAAPHLGAWEMVGLYCSAHYPMTSLYRPPRMAELDKMIRESRERAGATLVPTDASGVRALYKALGNGELIGILPDQIPNTGNGLFAPFFGNDAYTMVLLPRLVQKTGAAVFFTYAERLPRGRGFHLHFVKADAEIGDPDPLKAVAALNRGVEQCVRSLPEQYQWSYRRFYMRPGGQLFHYNKSDLPTT
ncbi:MAG: lipid A biosynthesis lauroyl acyltransferase [Gammaproteobacteria bacterium]|nr:MAG: lipid A biosynthesis lauroyl acyltransferase [Gammaproteobacteria bacterium]TND04052.1 MAG: lipid A biosynthesis lauroyl acyltransferase [Gammaproteobacteria bacterium]